ncbi:MAG: 50S ribosomal protein L31 [Flavobacteriales bacterium]|nr:50S ribosomal protein L31 [Flavobacteriales bacterium]
MKKNIHPDNYRLVVFKDMSNGDTFITKSCADSKDTIKIDGQEYPLIKREISSTSHPFYTGKMKLVDTAGRVDKFYKKFGKTNPASSDAKNKLSDTVSKGTSSTKEAVAPEAVAPEAAAPEASNTKKK